MRFDSQLLALYLIADSCYDQLLERTEQALQGGVTLVQLRMKDAEGKDFFEMASQMKFFCDQYKIPLVINDRVDIALAVDAAGVHLGQTDLPVEVVRKIVGPEKIIGITGRTKEDFERAAKAGADYGGAGAFTFTGTKPDCLLITLEEFENLCSQSPIPLVGIGGITTDTSEKILSAGAAGVSVCSAILGAQEIQQAASKFLSEKR